MRHVVSTDKANVMIDLRGVAGKGVVVQAFKASNVYLAFGLTGGSELDSNTSGGGEPSNGFAVNGTIPPLALPAFADILWARSGELQEIEVMEFTRDAAQALALRPASVPGGLAA